MVVPICKHMRSMLNLLRDRRQKLFQIAHYRVLMWIGAQAVEAIIGIIKRSSRALM